MTAALELQSAIISALRASSSLTGLLGGAFVYDDVPDSRRPPYVVLGPIETVDWSTATEDGEEHFIEITAWSQANGRKQAVAVTAEIRAVLSTLQSNLPGHALVNFTHETTRSEADPDDRHFTAVSSFRAVTEPLA